MIPELFSTHEPPQRISGESTKTLFECQQVLKQPQKTCWGGVRSAIHLTCVVLLGCSEGHKEARAHISMHGSVKNSPQIFFDDTSEIWQELVRQEFIRTDEICMQRKRFDTIAEVFISPKSIPNGLVLSLEKDDALIGSYFGDYTKCFYLEKAINARVATLIRSLEKAK